jgi:hypothetical protein
MEYNQSTSDTLHAKSEKLECDLQLEKAKDRSRKSNNSLTEEFETRFSNPTAYFPFWSHVKDFTRKNH